MADFQQSVTRTLLVVSIGVCFLLYFTTITNQKLTFEKATFINIYKNIWEQKDGLHIVSDSERMQEDFVDIIYDTVKDIKTAHGFKDAAKVIERNYVQFLEKLDSSRTSKVFKGGVILVSRYAEQQVGAAMNMFSLQKWAKTVNASVVEPFVINSEFRLPLVTSQAALSSQIRFRDYFNINIWNEMSMQNNGAPLISWEYFLNHKPKKYIFVNIINDLVKDVEKPVHIDDEIENEPLCKESFLWFKRKYSFYSDKLVQAELVRRVCLSFAKTRMNISYFTQQIYGPHNPSEVIVWILIWKGFAYNTRVRINEQYYHRSREAIPMIHASNRIIRDARSYTKRYLGADFGEYIGISIRTVVRAKFLEGEEDKYSFFKDCFKRLGETMQSLNITGKKIFTALDLGRFGDNIQKSFIPASMITSIEDMLFETVYNGSVTMQEWESSFVDNPDGIADTGYIATLQKTILDNSKCLIMFGGRSNFQRSILVEYKEKHGNNSCVYDVCYTP